MNPGEKEPDEDEGVFPMEKEACKLRCPKKVQKGR